MAMPEGNPPTTSYSFPDDLMYEILFNLSVKSLLRLKAVSKTWLFLISSSSFVDSHHSLAITRSEETIIGTRTSNNNGNTISLIHLDSRQHVVDLDLPYSKDDSPILPHCHLVGSCNGIVCAVVTNCSRKYKNHQSCEKYNNQNIYLWNSATKHSKLISPRIIQKKSSISLLSYGFGFDSIANDFKVVRVVSFSGEPTRIEVYSANKNAWRKVQFKVRGTPYYPVFYASVKGVLYSIWSHGVLRFDLNKEVFNYDIRFPVSLMKISMNGRIIEYKDSIAVIDMNCCATNTEISFRKVDDACLSVGSKGSWTLMFSFNLALQITWVNGYLNSCHILVKDLDHICFLCDVISTRQKEVLRS